MRIASIDIGSNTILMLIADIMSDNQIKIVQQYFSTPRLGENLDKTGLISEEALMRAKSILYEYKLHIDSYNVNKTLICATAAMREAQNSNYIRNELEKIIKNDILIINGEDEALFSYLGAISSKNKAALLDIGGASTEIMLGENQEIIFRKSFKLGAVRMTERFSDANKYLSSSKLEEMINYITNEIDQFKFDNNGIELFSVAGTPCAIATALKGIPEDEIQTIDYSKLYRKDIFDLMQIFRQMSPNEISQKYMITPKRADLITTGAVLLYTFLDVFDFDYTIVSSKGLRFGIIQNYLNNI